MKEKMAVDKIAVDWCVQMELTIDFWKEYELDIALVKTLYLKWALNYMRPPSEKYIERFIWGDEFCVVNSRYGRSFSQSFGSGVHGVPKLQIKGNTPRGIHLAEEVKYRLSINTAFIREHLRWLLDNNSFSLARNVVLNWYFLKLVSHEILFDRVHLMEDEDGILHRGKWILDQSDKWNTLSGIRNRIINVCRYGDSLEIQYVKALNKKLPGFTHGSKGTFIERAMTWSRYGMCAFDCGPILWSKGNEFVQFREVASRMRKLNWPYHGTPRQILEPFYKIALDYKRYPIRVKGEPEDGYALKSMRRRKRVILQKLNCIIDEIEYERQKLNE